MASGWAAMALGAARRAGVVSASGDAGTATITYLERTLKSETGAGSIERTVLALRALGQSVDDVNGVDLLGRLRRLIKHNGSVENKTNLTTWEILALQAAGARVPARTVNWLEHQQDGDGGFNYATGSRSASSDPDDTGAALEALSAAGAIASDHAQVTRAIHYLRRDQNMNGGFGYPLGATSNTESTAWALQGLIAAKVNVSGVHRHGGRTATHYLEAMTRKTGEVAYAHAAFQTPVWTTAEVIPALLDTPYPVDFVKRTRHHGSKHTTNTSSAPAANHPLAGSGGALKHVTPNVPLSLGRLIVSLHSLL
jgi:hypothetical protein